MPDTFTENKRAADFILSEDSRGLSRDAITIKSGEGVVKSGTVLRRVTAGAPTVAAPVFTGTGNGAMTLATPAYSADVRQGAYRVTCIEPGANVGTFEVVGPDGVGLGRATVGVAYDGEIKFTIADGATDFVAGDFFVVAVSGVADEYEVSAAGEAGDALNIYPVDATSAAVKVAAITRNAQVNVNQLSYAASVDNAAKRAALHASLARKNIIVR